MVKFSVFGMEIPFLCKFGPKNPDSSFELKFRIKTDLNMQNSTVMRAFSCLD